MKKCFNCWNSVEIMATSANLDIGAQLIVEECPSSYSLSGMPDIKIEHQPDSSAEEGSAQGVAMGMKFILPNRFDMNVCSRFVKSLNEEDSKNIQDQVNSDLEVASVLFKGWKLWYKYLHLFCFCLFVFSFCSWNFRLGREFGSHLLIWFSRILQKPELNNFMSYNVHKYMLIFLFLAWPLFTYKFSTKVSYCTF